MTFSQEISEILAELEPALRATLNASERLRARSLRLEAGALLQAASMTEMMIGTLRKLRDQDTAIAARIAAAEAVHRGE